MQSKKRRIRNAYLFLIPSLFGTSVFVLIPFLDVFRRSCFQAVGSGFVGLSNYRSVIENKAFWLAVTNTVKFMGICLPLLLFISLGIAVMIWNVSDKKSKGTGWIKTGFMLPMIIPVSSVVVFFQMLFDEKGWLNLFVERLGLQGADWINCDYAFWVLVICYIWKNLGYDMLLWLTGLLSIEEEQYEAARVQGAGWCACFRYITLPQLKETMFVTGLLSFVNIFRVFREAYLLAGDYPHKSIYMIQHLFNNWFLDLDIQKLTAAAVLLVIATGVVLLPFSFRHFTE